MDAVLPNDGMEEPASRIGSVGTTEITMLPTEATEASLAIGDISDETGSSRTKRMGLGEIRKRLVEIVVESRGARGDEQCMVRAARIDKSDPKVRVVNRLIETAGCDNAHPVV